VGWIEPQLHQFPVAGGELTVGRWGNGTQVVVACHGITANHRSFGAVAAELASRDADVSLYALDHRGRGGSATLPGPFGLAAHARDVVAVLDHLGVSSNAPAVLVGHSMGAYVAANATELAGERVGRLVLVDGALPIAVDLPADTPLEVVVRSVIGPALDRLDATFASPEDYVAMWREHPAVGGAYFDEVAEAYVRYDLVEEAGVWRSPVNKDAVLVDGGSVLQDVHERSAVERIDTPTVLLWAPRGLLDQTPGLLPSDVVDAALPRLPHVRARLVDDVNHYSLLLGERGAAAVADAIVAPADSNQPWPRR
jgi:pimeloyl-ACP methyl ester carboxylesterase